MTWIVFGYAWDIIVGLFIYGNLITLAAKFLSPRLFLCEWFRLAIVWFSGLGLNVRVNITVRVVSC